MDEASNLQQELRDIDIAIARFESHIEKGNALKRLKANKDFISLVELGYIESEAKKLFDILVDPSGASPYTDEQVLLKLATISDLRGYLGTDGHIGTIESAALAAPDAIDRERIYRQEITSAYAMYNNEEV